MNIVEKVGLEKSVIFIAALVSFITAFLSNCISVAVPVIARDLLMSNIVQNWISTIFLLVIAMLSIPFGKVCGKYGFRKSLLISLIVVMIGVIGSSLAYSSEMLLFFRAFQGIGDALLCVASMALIVSAVPPQNRGRALGLNIAGVYIGLSLAPVISGFLTFNFGWRSIFYIVIPLLIIAFWFVYSLNGEWTTYKDEPIDKIGSIVYILGIMLFIYGFTIINTLTGVISFVVGLILLAIFGFIELRVEYPLFNVRLFKNIRFTSSTFASLIGYFATFVITYVLNYHFQYIMGLNSQSAGLILIITPIMMAILAPISGKLSDSINPQKIAAIGMACVAIAILILSFLNESTPLYIIAFAMFLQGIGYGLFSSPNTNAIMSSVPKKETPAASASVASVRVIGQTLSLGMLTVIFAIIMGNVTIIPQNYPLLIQSSQYACIISVILCIIAMISSLLGMKSSKY
ncbi:MAG: MFS transporter [Methanobacteriaceae archaeon]|nr:MFS transporter [Methanobacteriaceae archaeon]